MGLFSLGKVNIKVRLSGHQVSKLKELMHEVYESAQKSPRVLNRRTWPGLPKPSGLQNAYDVFFRHLEDAKTGVDEMTDKHVHSFSDEESALKKLQSLFTVVSHDISEFNADVWRVNETEDFRKSIRALALAVKKIIIEMMDEEKGFLYALATSVHDVDKGCKVE